MIAEVGGNAEVSSSNNAHVAELVDAHGSGPCAARCGGSSPSVGTTTGDVFRKVVLEAAAKRRKSRKRTAAFCFSAS